MIALRWALTNTTGVLITGGKLRMRRPCDKRGRGWSDAATTQGIPRTDGRQKKSIRGKEGFAPTGFKEGMALLTP